MNSVLLDLLQRQQRDGFPDLGGSEVVATIPVSERLVNEAVSTLLPPGSKVREVEIRAEADNRLTARVRLSASTLLPAIPVTLAIEEQPRLPEHPILSLRLAQASGFVALAASTLPSMLTLPPGISIDGEHIRLDIRRLLAERKLDGWLEYLKELRITTRAGAIVLYVRVTIG
jgi:hypothetical protein